MSKKSTFSAVKRRNLMAIILALITATVMIPGMTVYLPFSFEEQILIPILLFPFIWSGLFIYTYMAEKAWHPLVVMLALTFSHAGLSYYALTQGASV
ncbi:hypothetical protein G3R49_17175 [Shewanella sp. WXL01]|uniref:hypothetical protein n=1 Tax=Shewanella sp. WXL01 TaxID=2709721 RepID=UPI001438322E|nr:hypothetical protein [Shewanella sp. WXL01]NKF52294.1 hypothetical protein [Shewanella sp. WXL01]